MKKYKFELVNTDICLPDYFSGDSRIWATFPIYYYPTLDQTKAHLRSEVNQGALGGSMYDWEEMESEELNNALLLAIEELKPNEELPNDYKFFTDVELFEDEHSDCVTAFFVFVPVDCEEE